MEFKGQKFKGQKSKQDIRVSKILQKTFIDVNEKGSEAGAATASRIYLFVIFSNYICLNCFMF